VPRQLPSGRTGAAAWRNLGDSKGQQRTTNVQFSGRFSGMYLGRECPGLRFHSAFTRQRPQVRNLSRPPAQTVSLTLHLTLAVSRLSATIPRAASCRTTAPRLASWLSRADVVPSEAAEGCVSWCAWHGMQGVRGSNPLSSTPGQTPSSPSTTPDPTLSGSRLAANDE
jgi:hypothetical protein